MASAVTSSESITPGQIGKLQELLAAGLRKSDFKSEPLQLVLEKQGDAMTSEIIAAVRAIVHKYADAVSNLISRTVKVDRTRTPQEALDATNRVHYTDRDVVKAMPKGEGDEVEVVFFTLGRWISVDDLEKEFELRGLKPADPYSLAAVNEAEPAFADERPNGTQWKDAKGKWCFATFGRGGAVRRLSVDRHSDGVWGGFWWFAGVRK